MNTPPIPSLTEKRRLSILILAGIACLAAAAFWGLGGARKDFYNELWAPAHLLVQGENPYDTSSLESDLPPLWLPPAVGVFAPLGWLPEGIATQVWLLVSLAALALTVWLCLEKWGSIPVLLLAALTVFLFPPALNHLALGQFSIISTLGCLLAALCAERKRPWAEAFLLALALAKPQLAFLAALGLGFHTLRQEGFASLLRFGLRTGAAFLLLSLPVILVHPGWLQDLSVNLRSNPDWPHPSLFTFLRTAVGAWAFPLWGLVLLGGISACWRLWKTLPPKAAMPWTLALTVPLAPYIGSWDFVLLLPLWVWIFSRVGWKRRFFLLAAYLAGWAGMAAIQLSSDFSNLRFWWVPFWFLAALWAAGRGGQPDPQ